MRGFASRRSDLGCWRCPARRAKRCRRPGSGAIAAQQLQRRRSQIDCRSVRNAAGPAEERWARQPERFAAAAQSQAVPERHNAQPPEQPDQVAIGDSADGKLLNAIGNGLGGLIRPVGIQQRFVLDEQPVHQSRPGDAQPPGVGHRHPADWLPRQLRAGLRTGAGPRSARRH